MSRGLRHVRSRGSHTIPFPFDFLPYSSSSPHPLPHFTLPTSFSLSVVADSIRGVCLYAREYIHCFFVATSVRVCVLCAVCASAAKNSSAGFPLSCFSIVNRPLQTRTSTRALLSPRSFSLICLRSCWLKIFPQCHSTRAALYDDTGATRSPSSALSLSPQDQGLAEL